MSDPLLPGTAEAWQGKKVLLIQDNWKSPDYTDYLIQQLVLHRAHVYLVARPSTSNLEALQTDPSITGVILYTGGNNPWSLFKFARTHPFEVVVLHLKNHNWERYINLIVSFFFWKAPRKFVVLQDGKDLSHTTSPMDFWRDARPRIGPIIRTVILRPYIVLRNRYRSTHPIVPSSVHRILFVRFDHIGDIIQATALIDPLRIRFPNASIDVLVGPWSASLFMADSRIRKVLVFAAPWHDRRASTQRISDPPTLPKNLKALISMLKKEHYDLAIDSRGDFFDSLVAYRSGAKRTAGTHGFFYNTGSIDNAFLLTYRAEYGNDVHPAVAQHARLARVLGCDIGSELTPHLVWGAEEEVAAKAIRDAGGTGGIRIAVHMYSGGSERVWPKAKFTEALTQLSNHYHNRIHLFLIGSPEERDLNEHVIEKLPKETRVSNVAGKLSLRQLPAFLAGMDVFVGNSSGPMHVADAVGVPVMTFALRHQENHLTESQKHRNIILTTLDDIRGIDTIEVPAVVEAVKRLVDRAQH